MKLSTKLSLLFFAIMLVFGGVSYYAVSRFQHDVLEKEVVLNLADDARTHLDSIDKLVVDGMNDVRYLSGHRLIASRKSTPAQVHDTMQRFLTHNPQYVAASFYDINRKKIASAGQGIVNVGQQHLLNEYWPAVYEGREQIVDISMSTSLQVPTAHFVNPVKDDAGAVFGVIVLRAPVSSFFDITPGGAELDSRKSSYRVDLLDRDGLVLYSNHEAGDVLNRVDDDFKSIGGDAHTRMEKDGYAYFRRPANAGEGDGGERMIVLFREQGTREFKGNGWTLKIAIPEAVALVSVRELEEKLAGVLLFVTSLAVLAAIVAVWNLVIRPLRNLGDAMRKVGHGELESKLPVRSNDEIGRLFRRFNAMSTSLHQMHEELDQAVDSARTASQIKSDFLANMSHEIRTPMNAIIGLTTLCQQTELTARQQDYLYKIRTSSQSLLRIINDILDLSKIEAGKMDIERVHFTLGEVLDNLVTVIADKSDEKGLELLLDTSLDVPFNLMGDPLRLGQVLLNLSSNAIKFTQKGEVLIQVAVEEDSREEVMLRFSVIDTGVGLTSEQMDSLFQPFVQADTSITRKFGGTGLGLSISKNLVELMGGRIWAESTVGKGAKFSFTARFGKVEWRTGKNASLPKVDLYGKHLLIVDDNDSSRHLQRDYLENYVGQVTLAASGGDALEAIRHAGEVGRGGYDAILIDFRMPEMDGIETAQRIAEVTASGKRPRVLLLGSGGDDESLQRELERGVIGGFLPKPFHQAQLLKAVMRVMQDDVGDRPVARRGGYFDFGRGKALSGARLLLVEDNRINQQVGRELLEKLGISVTIANHGEEALAMLDREKYDGVLMDMQMPVMDGITATREIRKQAKFSELPIIAMTANAMLKDREACLAAGMNDYIDKPIDLEKMVATLGRWVRPAHPVQTGKMMQSEVRKEPVVSSGEKEISGLNMEQAMRRVGGSDFYFRVLADFRSDQADVANKIRVALEAGDMKAALLLTHTLKGLLGMVGAERLQERTAEMERVLREDAREDASDLLMSLAEEIATLYSAIDSHFKQ